MGAKSQADSKDKPVNTCEECSREFLTLAALKSHTMAKHPEKYKQMQSNESVVKEGKKTALVPPTSRVSKRLQHKKSTDKEIVKESKDSNEIGTKSPNVSAQGKRKTMFECPKCSQLFPVYFTANKHIQKRHCVDEDGNPISPDALDLIKPIAKEMLPVKNIPSTNCTQSSEDNGTYCCLACKKTFKNLTSFDEHVEESHDDKINVFTLENMTEFFYWKTSVEAKQRVKYLMLSNTTQKKYYQCNYVSTQNSAKMTHLCPALMIVQELSKGVHIRYHKEHHEHICESVKDYSNPNTKNTQSTKDSNDASDDLLTSEEDLYTKLKDLLNIIVQKASVLKQPQLKHLYKSAIEMRLYLDGLKSKNKPTSTLKRNSNINTEKTEIDNKRISDDDNREETEEETINQSMTDDQITKVLEGPRVSARLKRKGEGSPAPEVKKTKLDKPLTQKTGLKENNSQNKSINGTENRFESSRPTIASPSFNDSYKQFLSSPQTDIPKTAKKVKKEVVKTKIGQFSPKKSPTVKIDTENVGTKKKKVGPSKQNTSLESLNLEDVEYEVVEQENDCNILILKI